MDSRRSDTARENDDSDVTELIEPTPAEGGRSGGVLQEDVATKAELERVRDPEAHEGVEKQDKIDHRLESSTRRPADKTP
ncbi:MAG TPA: hypothetical protein VHU79_06485 [Sphingomicrobium sp.]|nr:hypothetical protein [Sphingomicrobium sp.]